MIYNNFGIPMKPFELGQFKACTGLLSFRTICMINIAIVVVMMMIKSGVVIIMG